jgi:hypothetical protein
LLAALALQVSSVHAQNLVQNPDFDSGLVGWTTVEGTFAIDASNDSPAPPSLHATAARAQSNVAEIRSDCIQIDASQNVALFANIKDVSGGGVEVNLYSFADIACSVDGGLVTIITAPQSSTWSTYSRTNLALPSGTHSVLIGLDAFSLAINGSVDSYFDHILFGPTPTPTRPSPAPALGFVATCALAVAFFVTGSVRLRRRRVRG